MIMQDKVVRKIYNAVVIRFQGGGQRMYKKAILDMLDMIQSEKELKKIYLFVLHVSRKKESE